MESTTPERRHSHGHTRQWTPSPLSENEQFEQYYESQPDTDYYTQPGPPPGPDQTPAAVSSRSLSSTLQPLQEPRRKPKTKLLNYWSPWTWEIANCGLLLVSLFAILATLYPHDGQPLPKWPFSITINALLSIYAVVMKACMLLVLASGVGQLQWSWFLRPHSLKDVVRYREAADGPLGAVSWLYRHHVRQPLTALAALIIITAVAVDPFIQQLVQPVDCKRLEAEGQAPSIPRTNYLSYDSGSFPHDLLSYIASGYYAPQNLSDFTCGTGNCTFNAEYSSLAYCSVCEDVSDSVKIDEHCIVYQNKKSKPGSCYDVDRSAGAVVSDWNLTTTLTAASPPLSLNFHYNFDVGEGKVTTPTQKVFGVGRIPRDLDTSSPGNTISRISLGNDMGIILAKTDISQTDIDPSDLSGPGRREGCDDAATNNTWWCRQWGAATCSLQPCVRSYTASVDGGRLAETIVDKSDANLKWGYGEATSTGPSSGGLVLLQNFLGLVDTRCINEAERQALTAAGYSIDSNDNPRWLPYNLTFNPRVETAADAPFPESLLAHKCLYALDAAFSSDVWAYILNQFIIGTVERAHSDGDNAWLYQGSTQLVSLFDTSRVNETTVGGAMGKLADAVTLWIRTHGHAAHSARAVGEEFRYAICVRVNWGWAALPASLTALTLLFFLLTVLEARRRGLRVWKGSPLTLLFHGPGGMDWVDPNLVAADPGPKATAVDLTTDRGMQDFADRITVQVSRGGNGNGNRDGDGGGDGAVYLSQVQPRPRPRSSTRSRKPWSLWRSKKSGKRLVENDELEYSEMRGVE